MIDLTLGVNNLPERIGEQPKPRLLIVDPKLGDSLDAIIHLAPAVRVIESSDLDKVRQKDWDAAIVFGNATKLESHLYVVQFGGSLGGAIPSPDSGSMLTIMALSRAAEFVIPDDLPDSVRPLIRPSLVALLESEPLHNVMRAYRPGTTFNYTPDIARPFISDDDGNVFAGAFARPESSAQWWWLPEGIEGPERWVAAALTEWANNDAEKFPGTPQWREREEWKTPAEIELTSRIQAVRARYKAVLADLEQEEFSLATELEVTVAEADATARRLLTAQSDDLVDEVQATLEELGFAVRNVDKEIANPGDRREDLRVSTGDRPGWTAIVEVRGYKRGAQLNDLMRIGRFVTRYVQEIGKPPDKSWYVVNQYFDQDPTARPLPLVSNPLEVQTFAEDNGLIIDSRYLFQLRMRVRAGHIQARSARAKLIDASGQFGGVA